MANPFAAQTELLIMRRLRSEPGGMYGLELVKVPNGPLKRGTMYVTLGRMEEKGYIRPRAKPEANHSGIPQPTYKLPPVGQRVLAGAKLAGWRFSEP